MCCFNIPYGSMASVITADPVQRTQLSNFRSVGPCWPTSQ